MLAAMPTDPAAEAVEHLKNLARERREVFDDAELIDAVAHTQERPFATLLGSRDPGRLIIAARSATHAISGLLAEEAAGGEQRQSQRRI